MSEEEDQSLLDPKSSPDGLTKKGNSYNAGTKRANNVPLFVIGGFVAAFAFGAVYAGFGRGHSSVSAKKEEKHQVSAEDIAKAMLAQKPVAGTTQPASPPKMPELPSGKTDQTQATITVAKPPNPDKVLLPPQTNGMANTDNSTSDDYEQQKKQLIEQEKLAQMRLFYDSTKASSYVPVAFPRSGGSSPTQEQATQNNTIQSQMEALRQKIRENNGEHRRRKQEEPMEKHSES